VCFIKQPKQRSPRDDYPPSDDPHWQVTSACRVVGAILGDAQQAGRLGDRPREAVVGELLVEVTLGIAADCRFGA
jgi:hypothetical protein